jgi:chitodextrinase
MEPLASTVGHTCPASAPRWHEGIDISLPCATGGTPLSAPVPVTVVSIGEGGSATGGLGPNYPRLRLPDGRSVLLGHSSATAAARNALTNGSTVPAGTILAMSGGAAGSGASTGCHLHFEVHTQGGHATHDDIDPTPTLNMTNSLPAQPASPRVVSTTGTSAVLAWTDASNNEESFVSHYRIGTGSWVAGPSVGANATTMTVTGLQLGTPYTFQVGARNARGTKWSIFFDGRTVALPAQPTSPAVRSITATTAVLGWTDASNNESSFVSQYRVGTGPWVAGPSVGANSTTLTVSGLSPATPYTFQVGARNAAGTRWSDYVTRATPQVLPGQPGNPLVTSTTGSSAALAWTDASNNEDGFVTQYRIGTGAWVAGPSAAANATSVTVGGLSSGTAYTFQVGARNSAGTRWSAYFNGSTVSLPAQPASVHVASTSSSSAVLAWTDASNNEDRFVTQYRIGTGAWVAGPSTGPGTTSVTVGGLSANTAYTFQVGAQNSAGTHWSAYANGGTTTAAPPLPAEPTSPRVTSTSSSSAVLAWTDASNNEDRFVTQYRIGTGAWLAGPSVGPGTTSVTVGGLSANTAYTFQVGAQNSAGTHWSAYAPGTTTAAAPTLNYQVTNYDNDGTTGVYLRNSANINDVIRDGAHFVPYGTTVTLICGGFGSAVGPSANTAWDYVRVSDGRTGWISEHWLNTPIGPNQHVAGEPNC